jgi:hypothetical protein
MQYALLVYVDPDAFSRQTPEELAQLDEESYAEDNELRDRGHLILAQALKPVSEAVSVRVRDGRMSATAGPFVETAEHLGGVVFLEARDLNEAVQLASEFAIARFGGIEVRPVMDLEAIVMERRAAKAAGG